MITRLSIVIAIRKKGMACAAGAILVILVAAACFHRSHPERSSSTPARTVEDLVGYPRGTWRVNPDAMRGVILSYSEILVSFAGAERPRKFPPVSVSRSQAEALTRAQNIARALKERPGEFATLAERYSDEPTSRSRGGYAGVRRALGVPSTIVDALGVLNEGQVSHVIETEFGYCVVQRLKVPPDQTYSSDEIVIQHRDLKYQWTRPGRDIRRTREEALLEANRVAGLAQKNPGAFRDLVHSASDGYDAIADGDLGLWSLYTPAPGTEIAIAVSRLEMDGTTVVEDEGGFHVLHRKPPTQRQWLQSEEIVVMHSKSSLSIGDTPSSLSRQGALALATRVLHEWQRRPGSFAALSAKYCGQYRCKHPRGPWRQGGGIPGLDGAIASLAPGEFAPAPIETPLGFHLVRRVAAAPEATSDEKFSFDVPDPGLQKVGFFFDRGSQAALAGATLAFKPVAVQKLELTGDTAARLGQILDDLAESLRTEPPEKRSAIREVTRQSIVRLLGEAQYARYVEVRDAWVNDQQEHL
jgi:hypothetical protein